MPSNGASLTYSTLYGGSGPDTAFGVASDSNGAAYVAGVTSSPGLPMAGSGFDQSFNGYQDAFVAKFIDGPGPVQVTVASSPTGRKVKAGLLTGWPL